MQDLKHLTNKNKKSISERCSTLNKNRPKGSSTTAFNRPKLPSIPTGKKRERLKHLLLFIAIVIGLTPVIFLLIKKVPATTKIVRTSLLEKMRNPAPTTKNRKTVNSFSSAISLIPTANYSSPNLTATTASGEHLEYTINSGLQKRVHDFMEGYQVPYGVFVAIEPATGRILAMTAHSSVDPNWASSAALNLYPMASLFKIITASAALEQKKITPESVVEFRGNSYSENPNYWITNPRGGNNKMNVTYAMGKSINPLYGRIACDIAGKSSIMECVDRFGFNQSILPGVPVKTSQAAAPQSDNDLRLMGAGLDHEVKISPLHTASIMAAIANGGKMMQPGLTERILTNSGAVQEQFSPKELRQLVSTETAHSLTRMLSSTVTQGTSRKAFHDRRGRPLVNVNVAAKTGSINGTDPHGYYSWFAAFAPIEKPEIALVALVINHDKWRIKSSHVGAQALEEFFSK